MKNILWISNILFPEAITLLSGSRSSLIGSGGWLVSSAESLISLGGYRMVVVAPTNLVNSLQKLEGSYITFYALPCKNERKYNKSYEAMFREIVSKENIDIAHLHGTEFAHGLAFLRACPDIPSVLSIQGISEEIGCHYLDGFSIGDVLRNITFFDLVYNGSLYKQRARYIRHGNYIEREIIKKVKHIIGRTSFDRAHTAILNRDAIYYKCNESLRTEFYDGSVWNSGTCMKHSIFLSQSSYPIKGLQQVLKAMPYVLRKYPDAHIRVAGADITKVQTIKQWILRTSYSKYITGLIKKLGLKDKVTFTGPLDAEQMKKEYLSSNVFVSPSSIENSPNSVAEAQMLGVPCVASFVGGTSDMIPTKACGTLYRYEDVVMLANAICDVFDCSWDSKEEIRVATTRHNKDANILQLVDVYNSILNQKLNEPQEI